MVKQQHSTFVKGEKLCRLKTIETLFTNGKTLNNFPIRLLWQFQPVVTAFPTQIIFIIPKRNIKSAVERNRIRRQMREIYRLEKHKVNEQLLIQEKQIAVLIFFNAKKELPFHELKDKIILILHRLTETLRDSVK